MAASGRMWRRERTDDGFRYLTVSGGPLRSTAALRRIEALAIPPAWTEVQIAPRASDKIQAMGIDAAGRRQYIYNPEFVERRSERKFRRMVRLSRRLPRMREVTNQHLRAGGLGRERVLAVVLRLMARAYFRAGSERYAVRNRTYGIATLKKKHLEVRGNDLLFSYVGKGSADRRAVVAETPLVEVIEEILTLPGSRLFRYLGEDGEVRDVTAREVNAYIQEVMGERFTSKDLRTWGGTVRAATILADLGPPASESEASKNVVLACKLVASELGNTPAVCRASYVHPAVLDLYREGITIERLMRSEPRPVEAEVPATYYPEEAALMRTLEWWYEHGSDR